MKRSFRAEVAVATLALCPASFGTDLWLFSSYFSSHPTKPTAALGFVHALIHHGSYVYLSDTESTGLVLLMNLFIVGLFGAFAILPKDPTLAPPGAARWFTHFYDAAARTVAAIVKAVETLGHFPSLDHPGRISGTRELVVSGAPYIVPYRVRGNVVQLIRVFHAARKWPSQF